MKRTGLELKRINDELEKLTLDDGVKAVKLLRELETVEADLNDCSYMRYVGQEQVMIRKLEYIKAGASRREIIDADNERQRKEDAEYNEWCKETIGEEGVALGKMMLKMNT